MLVLAVIGMVIFVVTYRNKFNYKIKIRRVLDGRKLIEEDVGKLIKDKDGNKWLKRLKAKGDEKLMPTPPSAAEEIDKKGKIHVTANLLDDGSYQYVIDSVDKKNLDTLDSNQRMALANQIRKANARRGMTWKDYIPMIANGVIVLLILVCFMIFFNEVISPTKELAAEVRVAGQHFADAAQAYERTDSNIQILMDEVGIQQRFTNETPPS